ncbi:hypothetical protein SAMN05446037_1002115 [Anaerovirgula multivorans]|uniref:Uncharacterized protein n=1 Tax=Anaerovirgula multivorans TaxID=312168 RepID=A0A239AL44_9FIRM|nr:hypothetical protein SAMN05446037_1002115 [Anaerovirgula multivorans]
MQNLYDYIYDETFDLNDEEFKEFIDSYLIDSFVSISFERSLENIH